VSIIYFEEVEMNLEWKLMLLSAWPIFWITTVYSYAVCSVVGVITGIRTKNDKKKIDEEIEKFIISPFYVATFFSLFTALFFHYASEAKKMIEHYAFISILIIGLSVFIGHTLVELLEATFIRKDPLRMLSDQDAMKLSGIYLILIGMISFIVVFLH
jgi:hypothetical protein